MLDLSNAPLKEKNQFMAFDFILKALFLRKLPKSGFLESSINQSIIYFGSISNIQIAKYIHKINNTNMGTESECHIGDKNANMDPNSETQKTHFPKEFFDQTRYIPRIL